MKSLKELLLPPYETGSEYLHYVGWNACLDEVAKSIDALEASAVRVYGTVDNDGSIGAFTDAQARGPIYVDTHTALLLCVEPIARHRRQDDIAYMIRHRDTIVATVGLERYQRMLDLLRDADRIEKEGIRDE